MALYSADNTCDLPAIGQSVRPRLQSRPITSNGLSPSPKKQLRTAKEFYDSQDEDYSGKETPFKSPSKGLKLKRPGTGKQQRSLNLENVEHLLAPKVKAVSANGLASPAKSTTRASPKRQAKQNVSYAALVDASEHSFDEASSDQSFWSGDGRDSEDNSSRQQRRIPTKVKNSSTLGKRASSSSPKKATSMSPAKGLVAGPRLPNIFDDSDVENRPPALGFNRALSSRNRRNSGVSSSSFDDSGATLSFSPFSSKSPSRAAVRPSTPTRLENPSNGASPSKSRLLSPAKRSAALAPAPVALGRPSLDAFWNQDEVNTWNDITSPRKDVKLSPRKYRSESPLEDSPRKCAVPSSPSKKQSTAAAKKAFNAQKQDLAVSFLKKLDEEISGNEISRLAETSGGVKIIWSKKLNSTAGRANWRREAIKRPDPTSHVMTITGYRHIASIELAEKVIESEDRLYNVLAHEYCHLANFMISRVINNPHGSSFRSWADKATAAFGKAYGVEVTTKHDYDITYKYIWVCMSEEGSGEGSTGGCGTEYQRHSKSIDPARHSCGKCRGRLVQIKPKPRAGAGAGAGVGCGAAQGGTGTTQYQRFVKEQFQLVKTELPPGSPMKDVMKEIGVRYRARKETSQIPSDKGSGVLEVIEIADDEPERDSGADNEQELDVADIARKLDFLSIDKVEA